MKKKKDSCAKVKAKKWLSIDIKDCARCGKAHEHLMFMKLKRGGERHTHWAMCPNNCEPVMLVIKPDSKKKK